MCLSVAFTWLNDLIDWSGNIWMIFPATQATVVILERVDEANNNVMAQ